MGGKKHTVQNLKILKIDPVRDLIYVHGGVPGQNGEAIDACYRTNVMFRNSCILSKLTIFFLFFRVGRFLKVFDSVKGPYFPSPPPYPTWQAELPTTWQHAPVSSTDAGIFKEPEDPYN